METKIAIFKGKQVRKTIHDNEWWFSVIDVIEVLTDSANPRDYWYKMKIRVKDEAGLQLSTLCRQLKLQSSDGKKYETDCANTETMFRIIQSIPSLLQNTIPSPIKGEGKCTLDLLPDQG